jgi:hypothetical protein
MNVGQTIAKKALLATRLAELRLEYPAARVPDEQWDKLTKVWEAKLIDYPAEVITRAFSLASKRYPQWFPNLPQVIEIHDEEQHRYAAELAHSRRDRLLPPPTVNRDVAMRDFLEACDLASREKLDEWTPDARVTIEGLVVLLHPLFGYRASEARGNPDSNDPARRFDLVAALISAWKQRKFTPKAVASALHKVPTTFARFPTEGMIAELIRGSSNPGGWPPEYLKQPPSPAASPDSEPGEDG